MRLSILQTLLVSLALLGCAAEMNASDDGGAATGAGGAGESGGGGGGGGGATGGAGGVRDAGIADKSPTGRGADAPRVDTAVNRDGVVSAGGCVHNADCPAGQYCVHYCYDNMKPGVCVPKATTCSSASHPVCGCNCKTYDNACLASMAGVPMIDGDNSCEASPNRAQILGYCQQP